MRCRLYVLEYPTQYLQCALRLSCGLGATLRQARVPIIKFVDAETRIAVDVTFDKCSLLPFRRIPRRLLGFVRPCVARCVLYCVLPVTCRITS